MFYLKLFLITVLIATAFCGEDGKDKSKHEKHIEKMKKCMQDTLQLKNCCPYPNDDSFKDEPACKPFLEGIEDKEGKEKHKAYSCFLDCLFEKKGLYKDGELNKEKISEVTKNGLTANSGENFLQISENAINYCSDELEEKQKEWEKWMAKKKENEKDDKDDEKKCSFLPSGFSMCYIGFIVRDCPKDAWVNSNECMEIKANATSLEDCMKH